MVPPMSTRIRNATNDDLPAIEALFRAEAREARADGRAAALGSFEPPMMKDYIAKMEAGDRRHQLLVAEKDGQVAGFIMALHRLREKGDFTALHRWGVAQDMRGQGIGMALFGAMKERSDALGKRAIQVQLPEGNPVGLYRGLGFHKTGDVPAAEPTRRPRELYTLAGNPCLLIVDDDAHQLADFAYAYGKRGYNVRTALAVPAEQQQTYCNGKWRVEGNLLPDTPKTMAWRGFDYVVSGPKDVADMLKHVRPEAMLSDWELGEQGFPEGGPGLLSMPEAKEVPARMLHSGAVPDHARFDWAIRGAAKNHGFGLAAKSQTERVDTLLKLALAGRHIA